MEGNKVSNLENVEKKNTSFQEKTEHLNRESLEILTDSINIAYYKILQLEQAVEDKLLGSFDKNGDYSISKDILQEFVVAKKYIKHSKDNQYILAAPTKDGFNELLFALQIESENGIKTAIMRFVEVSASFNNEKGIIRINVARYKDNDDIYFISKVKKIFNIVDDSDGKEIDNEEFVKIVLKKFKEYAILEKELFKTEKLDKEYIYEIIAFLKGYPGKHSEYILRHYENYLEEYKHIAEKPGYYKNLRKKLDKLINQTRQKNGDSEIDKVVNAARKKYAENYERLYKEIFEEKTKEIETPAVKKQEQSIKKSVQASRKPKFSSKKNKGKDSAKKAKPTKTEKKSVQIIKPIIFNTLSQKIDKPKTDKEEKSNEKKTKKKEDEKLDLDIDRDIFLVMSSLNENKGNKQIVPDNKLKEESEKSLLSNIGEKKNTYDKEQLL